MENETLKKDFLLALRAYLKEPSDDLYNNLRHKFSVKYNNATNDDFTTRLNKYLPRDQHSHRIKTLPKSIAEVFDAMMNPFIALTKDKYEPTGEVFLMTEPPMLNTENIESIELNVKWLTSFRSLEKLGAEVKKLDGDGQGYIAPFPRDWGFIIPETKNAILLKSPDRYNWNESAKVSMDRQKQFPNYLKNQGFSIESLERPYDGGDLIVMPKKKKILVKTPNSLAWYEKDALVSSLKKSVEQFNYDVVSVGLQRKDIEQEDCFYHLDLAISVLPHGEIMFCPQLFNDLDQKTLRELSVDKHIIMPVEDAENYACNMVSVGNNLIMPTCSAKLRSKLEERGYNPITPKNLGLPDDMFIYKMTQSNYSQVASIHCLTQKTTLDLPPQRTVITVKNNLSTKPQNGSLADQLLKIHSSTNGIMNR